MAEKWIESYRCGYETRQFFVLLFQSSILLSRGGSFTDDRPDSSRPQTASSSRSDLVYSGRQQKSWKFDGYSSDNDVMPYVHFKAVFTLFRTVFRADNPIQCGWPRGFSCLNPSPYCWIFTSVSVGSIRFRHGPNTRFTLHQSVTQNLADMWRSTIEIGAAQIRSFTGIASKSLFSCMNRIPIQ